MAAKKKAKKKTEGFGAKKAFIAAHPKMPVGELLKLGKDKGITFSAAYVHNVRSLSRAGKKASKTSARSPEAIAKQKATIARKKRGTRRMEPTETESIGSLLQQAIEAMNEVRRRLSLLAL